jgi:hypothetical protein
MTLLIFLASCKTITVKLESPKDFTEDYNNCTTENEFHNINAQHIIEKNRIIYKLWAAILAADGKNIKIIDLRTKKDIEKYKEYIKHNLTNDKKNNKIQKGE